MWLQTVGEEEIQRNEGEGRAFGEKCIINLVCAINILTVYPDDAGA